VALWAHDRALLPPSGLIIGIDEVGRGPLAGNVVAACVILNFESTSENNAVPNRTLPGLNDSKKLTAEKRERLVPLIQSTARAWSIGEATPQEIDTINILQATFLAMRRALEGLAEFLAAHPTPALLLVDGNQKIPGVKLPQQTVVKGDGLSASIAAASVLAKVHRDTQLIEAETLYPGYGFAGHKGYGTKQHTDAITQLGLTEIHRKSFCQGFML
jgi:ribonuclease HII